MGTIRKGITISCAVFRRLVAKEHVRKMRSGSIPIETVNARKKRQIEGHFLDCPDCESWVANKVRAEIAARKKEVLKYEF